MLVRSQVYTMLTSKFGFFSTLPNDIIQIIRNSPTPDPDFLETLKHVAHGNYKAVKEKFEKIASERQQRMRQILQVGSVDIWSQGVVIGIPPKEEIAKLDKSIQEEFMRLLVQAGDVVTRSGVLVLGKTLLECAMGEGDWEMIELLKPYFLKFEGGAHELESQMSRYRPCIAAMATQQPDEDLTELFETLKACKNLQDVAEELKIEGDYDRKYQSELRTKINEFREKKLDPKYRIVTKPRMHCNYKNIEHIYVNIEKEWNNLIEGNNYDKLYLALRLFLGFSQWVELTGYDRDAYPRGHIDAIIEGEKINRSSEKELDLDQMFPDFNQADLQAHAGVGFDSYMILLCEYSVIMITEHNDVIRSRSIFQKLCQTKISNLQRSMQMQQHTESNENIPIERKHPGM